MDLGGLGFPGGPRGPGEGGGRTVGSGEVREVGLLGGLGVPGGPGDRGIRGGPGLRKVQQVRKVGL